MSSFTGNPNHWAFQEGAGAGREGNTTRRGLMSFGLSCAATSTDAENTRQWLAGFDSTAGVQKTPVTTREAIEYGVLSTDRKGREYAHD